MYENYDNVGQKLPNGTVKVIKSIKGSGMIFESVDAFNKEFQSINEGTGTPQKTLLLDTILG